MILKERLKFERIVGIMEGISWVVENQVVADALQSVTDDIYKLLKEDAQYENA